MRNVITQILPAGATLTVDVNPPLAPDERPILLPFRGRGSVVVHVIDNHILEITNATNEPAPFIIAIGKPPVLPPGLQALVSTLLAARRNT